MSNQNDTKLETDELASDLLSAIKEFEETTAKITLTHENHETKRNNVHKTQMSYSAEEKGPIDYFNRTKESLRHVPLVEHDTNNYDQKIQSDVEVDESESGDAYVKIPVQQLINTFEKQMRTIIKQKVNENIQLNMDVMYTTNTSNKISTTHLNKEQRCSFFGKENEIKANKQNSTDTPNMSIDIEAVHAFDNQQQTFDRVECEITKSMDEQYQYSTQRTTNSTVQQLHEGKSIELTAINSIEKQLDENFDGGKAIWQI